MQIRPYLRPAKCELCILGVCVPLFMHACASLCEEYEPEKRKGNSSPSLLYWFRWEFCELLSSLQHFRSQASTLLLESRANGVPIRLVIQLTFVFTALGPRRHWELILVGLKCFGGGEVDSHLYKWEQSKRKKTAMMKPALSILSHYHCVRPLLPSLLCEICIDASREENSNIIDDWFLVFLNCFLFYHCTVSNIFWNDLEEFCVMRHTMEGE